MNLLSLIFGGIAGAAICYVVVAIKSDDLQLALAITKSDLANNKRNLKKAETKLADIHQMSAPD